MNTSLCSKSERPFAVLGFGEVMMRLSPPQNGRIGQCDSFVKNAGGSELNVVSGVAQLGLRTGLISKIPANSVGQYIRGAVRAHGVSDDYLLGDCGPNARLGLYYCEGGGYPRKPRVVYDRGHSSFTTLGWEEIPPSVFSSTALFHTSGITLALGQKSRQTALALVRAFKQAGAKISFDVNYRASLWGEEEARQTIAGLLPSVDILFVSEETSRRMFGRTGCLEDIQRYFHQTYGVSLVASTQRKVGTPRCHTFGSMLYSAGEDRHYTEPPYVNIEVADRIGSGDAYVAGVLYALLAGRGCQQAVRFGNAMSALKNTVPGDMLATDCREIEGIIADHSADGAVSEMDR